MKGNLKQVAQVLIGISGIATILAVIGALTQSDIWLAPTQWILIAILTGILAIYIKLGV